MMRANHGGVPQVAPADPFGDMTAPEAAVPMNVKPAILVGLVVILLGLGGFGTWAAVAELSSAVVANGTVKVFSNRKKVQPLEGGVVAELLVRNGDVVTAGDVLIRLDQTRSEASYAIVQGNYDSTQAAVARLRAERDGADDIAFPDDLLTRRSEPEVAEILQGQRAMFTARRESLTGQVSIIDERIGQLSQEIAGLNAQVDSKHRQIELIEGELEGLTALFEKGYVPKTRLLALKREAASLQGERGEHLAAIARARGLISEARLEIVQIRKGFTEQVVSELRQLESEMYDLAERRNAVAYNLTQTEIKATASGYVVGLDVHTVGGVVQPGATLLEIVPADETLVIEARIMPMDIDDVARGLAADVQFTAFPQRTTPKVEGHVTYVSADSLLDQQTGQSYFLAHVTVPKPQIQRLGDRQLQPGMPADVLIKVGERTPLDYLMQPITDSMRKAWREP